MQENERRPPRRVRLWALFAARARKAVILRRGPRTHFHLIGWDLATDTFTHGQWMKGSVRLCDLSPSGDKLIYWAEQRHLNAPWRIAARGPKAFDPLNLRTRIDPSRKARSRRRVARYVRREAMPPEVGDCWTAISTPPYFSALAIWPHPQEWLTGGGVFLSDNEVVLAEFGAAMTPKVNVTIPERMTIRSYTDVSGPPRFSAWAPNMCDPKISAPVAMALLAAGATWVEWVAPREDGELLFACDGCIYRLAGWQDLAPERYISEARQVADFNGLTFTPIPPTPEAMRW